MKKLILIGVGFVLAVAVFGVAGFAYAQTQDPPEPPTADSSEFPYGRGGGSRGSRGGMMAGRAGFVPGGMMGFGQVEGEEGPLHAYLWPALVEAFGLTTEQAEAFETARETMQAFRSDLAPEETQAAMRQAMTTAIENALADGVITEEQAEGWLDRLDNMGNWLSGMPSPGGNPQGRMPGYRQGFSNGVMLGRQMMLNHEYVDAALSSALEISVEELQEMRAEEGFSWQAYAEQKGLSDAEIANLWTAVVTNAVDAALADGALTQEQADWMLDRMQDFEGCNAPFGRP